MANEGCSDHVDAELTSSASKLGNVTEKYEELLDNPSHQRNRIINLDLLAAVFALLACPQWMSTALKEEHFLQGVSSTCAIFCCECGYVNGFQTSKKSEQALKNNVRSVYAMPKLGKLYAGAATFCSVIDMLPPSPHSAYDRISFKVSSASETVAVKSMVDAAEEVQRFVKNNKCGISRDGTWQKKGALFIEWLCSLILVHTRKVTDVETLSSTL